jgi:lipoate---protein ligase
MISSAARNLALDWASYEAAERGDPAGALRCWESPEAVVVLGRSSVISRDIDESACIADGVEILRRESGGGAVVLGPGCVIFSLVLPIDRDTRASYCQILEWVAGALNVPGLQIRGSSDLAIGDRKVSGNAQRRGSRVLLHHGTLLCGLDSKLMERYLKPPHRQPEYRRSRSHTDFTGSLPLSAAQIIERLFAASGSIARQMRATPPGKA